MTNKAVAVVHWTEGGKDKSAKAYTIEALAQTIKWANEKGYVYVVYVLSNDINVPASSHKPITATLTPSEYKHKAETPKVQHKAFREVTRIDQLHHPPTIEKRNEAYRHHI